MKAAIGSFIGLVWVVCASAEPLIEGRVRLDSGAPVADAQVRLFDMTDLERGAVARATTDGNGYFALPWVALTGRALPERFALGPNYPNPFNPSTIIPYQLAASSAVRLEVFNLLGQRIATLVDGVRSAGFHTALWNATDAAGRAVGAGVYIYRMTVGAASQTGRMVLIDGQAGVAAAGAASDWLGASGSGGLAKEEVYGLVVSGEGLVPYVDSSFRVESGMAPVELVVSAGQYSAGKAADDDCVLCGLFGAFNDSQEEEADETEEAEEDETPEEETETDSTSSEGGPDLIVQSPSVSAVALTPGQAFTLHVTVHNQGDEQAAATMLHYYRSNNSTITSSDTEVGTDAIDALNTSATSAGSIELTVPTDGIGTYFYGACVDTVRGESNTDNNCSSAVRITVSGQETSEENEENETTEDFDDIVVFTAPQIHNDNVFVLPISEDLATGGYEQLVEEYSLGFYEYFSDEFDFLIFIPSLELSALIDRQGIFAFFKGVWNDVQGIGKATGGKDGDFFHRYGSRGKLQGVIFFSAFKRSQKNRHSVLVEGPMLHEFMHRWANFIVPPHSAPHWNTHWDFTSANGILGGFDIRDLKNDGDGQYRAPGAYTGGQSYNIKPYSPIELYLAGFIPPEEVPGLWVGLDGELVNYEWRGSVLWSLFTASRVKTYNIDDIIAEHGPRVPNHVHSQKDFRAAVILLVNEDYPVFSATLELLSDDASLFSYAGEDQFDDWYNFYEATGGRGTMAMDGLSQFKRDPGAAKRPALPSFGTLPPPIICHWH